MSHETITQLTQVHLPDIQAIYLFGSYGTANSRPDSDVDLALLLPPLSAKRAGSLTMGDLRFDLEAELGRTVDLVNIHEVNTVFQIARHEQSHPG